MIKMQIVY